MSTAAHAAIEAQAAALRTIARAAGFETDLGARVLWPFRPAGENPVPCIYRAGALTMDQGRDVEVYRLGVTWAALAVEDPERLDAAALAAQSDLVRALRGVCGNAQLRRLDIPAREPGSNTLVAAVAITTTIQEPQP